jgi:CBS domain-containing protein
MKAQDVMTRNPETVTSEQTVADAVSIMKSEHCGIVPVVSADSQSLVGVVTDRDIALGCCDSGASGPDTPVSAVMSQNLFCVDPDEDISKVQQMMERAGVRRIPVIAEDNHLVGIISLKDIADQLDDDRVGRTEGAILSQKPNS